MKKMNRKGFTIVELVIVIAVIAILAGVLIPTFSSIVTKAQNSAELQKVTSIYKTVLADELADGDIDNGTVNYPASGTPEYTFTFSGGKLTGVTHDGFNYTYSTEGAGSILSATKN